MVTLRERLTAHLEFDWRQDLEPAWRAFFDGFDPKIGGLLDCDAKDIFPDRLNLGRPRNLLDIPPSQHMLRAFDHVTPENVKVVVLGQDPYPRRSAATGRAFEDGDIMLKGIANVAISLRKLLQSAAAVERPDLEISEEGDDWGRVCAAIQNNDLCSPEIPTFFDKLAEQNVLCVNAAWTFTGKSKLHLTAHIQCWEPVLDHLLLSLARRNQNKAVVFLLLGRKAEARFKAATELLQNKDPEHRIASVYCAHPTAWRGRTYFEYDNPLRLVNQALVQLESAPVRWWPLPN